jgi:hypothetical protein
MIRNTPAVTSVDEWTSAETGVGAAIAAGSHLENGIWALLVIAATIIVITWYFRNEDSHILMINQWPWFRVHAIDRSSITSPMRFVNAVIIPAPSDFAVW